MILLAILAGLVAFAFSCWVLYQVGHDIGYDQGWNECEKIWLEKDRDLASVLMKAVGTEIKELKKEMGLAKLPHG